MYPRIYTLQVVQRIESSLGRCSFLLRLQCRLCSGISPLLFGCSLSSCLIGLSLLLCCSALLFGSALLCLALLLLSSALLLLCGSSGCLSLSVVESRTSTLVPCAAVCASLLARKLLVAVPAADDGSHHVWMVCKDESGATEDESGVSASDDESGVSAPDDEAGVPT